VPTPAEPKVLARLLFGERDEFGDRTSGQRRGHNQHVGQRNHLRDRRKIAQRVVRQVLFHDVIDGERARRHEQRVAVRRRAGRRLRADDGARAGPVVDDEGLAHRLRESLPEQARDGVGAAARR
jgi:hypothetical protein